MNNLNNLNNSHLNNNGAFIKTQFANGNGYNNNVNVKYNPTEYNKTQGNGFLNNRKNNTFRATTAGQNGRGATGQYKTIVTQPKTNEPLNNTYTPGVNPKDKNILIQMIDKKSPRPPTNGYGMITRR